MSSIFLYSLVGLDQLEVLRAQRVRIRRLPLPVIERLTSLRVLDVAENEIDAISEAGAVAVARLHELNLANNRLVNLFTLAESLSRRGGSGVKRRAVVDLAGNPWHCSSSDVPACRRLTAILDTRTHYLRHTSPRCASLELRSTDQSVLGFCRNLVAAVDNNQTALGCLDAQDFEQRVVKETAIFTILSIVFVTVVSLAASASLAYCRLTGRNTRRRGRHTAGTTRRNGYHIVGEIALDFADIQ